MIERTALFTDRRDAGRRLAEALLAYREEDPVVLALPRGGVPVAYEVARRLEAPLDLVFVRKIGAPHQPEFGLGAVVDGADPQIVLNPEAERIAAPAGYIEAVARRELVEIERRRKAYLGDRPPIPVRGRTAIVVDDGVATGGTIRAALAGLARAQAKKVVLAVPVGPYDVVASLRADADEVVCLATPQPFYAVGLWYGDFTQTTDAEVVELLHRPSATSRAVAGEDRPRA